MTNIVYCLSCLSCLPKGRFIEGVTSKHVLLAPLACSKLPSVTMSLTYGLKQGWATNFHQGPHEKPVPEAVVISKNFNQGALGTTTPKFRV